MPRRRVEFQSGFYYHVYNRGNNHQLIFFEQENYLYFLRQLRQYLVTDAVEILAYCLMPNHYHLLVYLKTEKFADLMQPFALSYTKAINKRYGRVGSLFQGRFQAIEVNEEEYLSSLSRYIHLNPVRAKLVEKPEDWEFSSYQEYAVLRGGKLPKLDRVMARFSSRVDDCRFVEDCLESHQQKIKHLMFE